MRFASLLALAVLLLTVTACGGKGGSKKSGAGGITPIPTAPAEPDPTDPLPETIPETDPDAPPTDTESTPPAPETGGTDPDDTDPSTGNLPPQALSFKVHLKLYQMTPAQVAKFRAAAQVINNVVASDKFRDYVVNYTYNGMKRFVKNKGMSNEQIYLAILDGVEKLRPVKNNTMELDFRLYAATFPEESYSYTNTLMVSMNYSYFRRATVKQLAGRMIHHWAHKLGFDYANTTPQAKQNTVPIALERMVGELGFE